MTTITVNNVNYALTRSGNGTPLILLHGFTGSSANWQRIIPPLAQAHSVIAPDILGHGSTGSPPDSHRYRMEYVAHDIVTAIRAMTTAPITLLGYSMGGRLALYIAANYPEVVNHLILESASPGLQTAHERAERRQRDNTLADNIEANGIAWFVEFWETLPLWNSQARLDHEIRNTLHHQRLENNPQGLANSLRGMGTGVQPSLWDRLPDINKPVLLLVGADDTKFIEINQKMAHALPDAQLKIVAEAGHTTHLEQPDQFCKHVLEFVTDIPIRNR